MPIQTEDIKLLKSAVMADVPEGGGAMTGIEVLEAVSNNLFPDRSTVDGALGRFRARQLYGVGHTDDTDLLLGAHVLITDAPNDPLVHCTLVQTPGWADTRSDLVEKVQRYLVKGPRSTYRLWDTHYAGGMLIRLISLVSSGMAPAGGDCVVLHNPNGQEQYVRILKTVLSVESVAVVEGSSTLVLAAQVVTCTIGNELEYDFFGPPAQRVGLVEANFAQLFTTNVSGGSKFYGIKPLAEARTPGAYSVLTAGGIYSPVVPAATVESPIIDQYPIGDREGVALTGLAPMVLSAISAALQSGTRFTTPTPIGPGTLSLAGGGNTFTDAGGELLLGTLVVGSVDYKSGIIEFGAASPAYGTHLTTLTYTPATVAALAAQSSFVEITIANQGRAFTNAFEPTPAPGSFRLSYMAQGRWYDLSDNMAGKLSGADSSYGSGVLNYNTGSMAVTLGAIPDVGSCLIADWGEQASATAISPSSLPLRLGTRLTVPYATSLPITMTWSRSGIDYTATIGTGGQVTGDATGWAGGGSVIFEPNVFPDGPVTMSGIQYETHVNTIVTPVTNDVAYEYQSDAATLPIGHGTLSGKLTVTTPPNAIWPATVLDVFDRSGKVYARYHGNREDGIANHGGEIEVGTINYDTGKIVLGPEPSIFMWFDWDNAPATAWVKETYKSRKLVSTALTIAPFGALTAPSYYTGTTTTYETTYETISTQTPVSEVSTASTWTAVVSTAGPDLLTTHLALRIGNSNYTAAGGILRKGWNPLLGTASSPTAGTVDSYGVITVGDLPDNFANGIVWLNASQDHSARQTGGGVFRTASAPLKVGVMQLQMEASIGNANEAGVLSGGGFGGTVDFQRGVVKWTYAALLDAALLSYNAVFLQYLPLNRELLGIDTVRLPLDGKVPIYRPGDLLVVHNTLTTQLPNPLVKGAVYDLGRERIASVRVKDVLGVLVPSSLYVSDLNPGFITFPVESNLTPYSHPFTVEHRIEDVVVCRQADISGKLDLLSSLTHDFPADTSFVSSALAFGDLFARAHGDFGQGTWTGEWSDALIGAEPLADFNAEQYPITTTNRGAITERWALIFTSNTAFKVVGENVGQVGTGDVNTTTAPNNPATGVPYFSIPPYGWGGGWAAGNVLRFDTAACGAPFWVVQTILQGPASLDSDVFSLAFRTDVDRP